jgi:hypothetical protein
MRGHSSSQAIQVTSRSQRRMIDNTLKKLAEVRLPDGISLIDVEEGPLIDLYNNINDFWAEEEKKGAVQPYTLNEPYPQAENSPMLKLTVISEHDPRITELEMESWASVALNRDAYQDYDVNNHYGDDPMVSLFFYRDHPQGIEFSIVIDPCRRVT